MVDGRFDTDVVAELERVVAELSGPGVCALAPVAHPATRSAAGKVAFVQAPRRNIEMRSRSTAGRL